jgi:hypothetical protein
MASKDITRINDKAGSRAKPATEKSYTPARQQTHPITLIKQADLDPGSLTPRDVIHLQRTIGNQAVGRLLAQTQKKENNTAASDKAGIARTVGSGQMSGTIQRKLGFEYELNMPVLHQPDEPAAPVAPPAPVLAVNDNANNQQPQGNNQQQQPNNVDNPLLELVTTPQSEIEDEQDKK